MHAYDNTLRTKVNTLFKSNLPRYLKCANDLSSDIHSAFKSEALTHKYIQANKTNSVGLIIGDIDKEIWAQDLDPLPNFGLYNPHNGRCHVGILLKTPVHLNDHSSLKAQVYLKRIIKAVTKNWGADQGYAGFICKNLLHPSYRPFYFTDELRELDYLAEWLPANDKSIQLRNLKLDDFLGLGRNSDIFHICRFWSYRAIRDYVHETYEAFHHEVLVHCNILNQTISMNYSKGTLTHREIKTIAKSISTWVYDRRYDFIQHKKQKICGVRSGIARALKAEVKKQEALKLLGQGLKAKQIAARMEISERSAWYYISSN